MDGEATTTARKNKAVEPQESNMYMYIFMYSSLFFLPSCFFFPPHSSYMSLQHSAAWSPIEIVF